METTKFKFVTVKQLAKKICNIDYPLEQIIGFTFNQPEELCEGDEPTGWYGITRSLMFNGETILIGYFGSGILVAQNTWGEINNTIEVIVNFLKDEGNMENANEDTWICVDANEFDTWDYLYNSIQLKTNNRNK